MSKIYITGLLHYVGMKGSNNLGMLEIDTDTKTLAYYSYINIVYAKLTDSTIKRKVTFNNEILKRRFVTLYLLNKEKAITFLLNKGTFIEDSNE